MEKWIVTAVDYGDSVDGKARVIKVANTEDEAKVFVRDDMATACSQSGWILVEDVEGLCVWDSNHEHGCEWNIEKVEIPA